MRVILLLLLLMPSVTFAQKTLGRETFMVNVRPVLNGILSDFYQMVALFPDFPKEIIPLIQELDGLTTDKENLRDTCPRLIEKKCQETIQSLRQRLAKIRSQSLDLLTQQRISSSLYMNSLTGFRLVTQFDSEMEEVKGYLDNAAFLLSAQIPQKRETYAVLKELDELNTLISLAIVEYIPFTYRDDFRHFYFNFVQPIQIQISKNKNYEFLNRNVNSLNFAINLLNQNLTKRAKKTPEGMAPYLAVIHNRWNSLLRYYF
jgi:prefoldin subunit 5